MGAASKFACVRAYKIIDAPLDQARGQPPFPALSLPSRPPAQPRMLHATPHMGFMAWGEDSACGIGSVGVHVEDSAGGIGSVGMHVGQSALGVGVGPALT